MNPDIHYKEIENGIFHIMDKGTTEEKQELLKFLNHRVDIIKRAIECIDIFGAKK